MLALRGVPGRCRGAGITANYREAAQPPPREHGSVPSTAITRPTPPARQHNHRRGRKECTLDRIHPTPAAIPSPNCHRGYSIAHPRQQLHDPTHLHSNPITTEGARKCTLDRRCLCTRPLNEAQPLPRVHRNAHSTADIPTPNHPLEPNCCRGRTKPPPRRRLGLQAHSLATVIHLEGSQQCTLDRVCPHSGRCSVTQLPPKVQHCAHSIAIARHNPPARQHNRHRGRKEVHPRPQIAQR